MVIIITIINISNFLTIIIILTFTIIIFHQFFFEKKIFIPVVGVFFLFLKLPMTHRLRISHIAEQNSCIKQTCIN